MTDHAPGPDLAALAALRTPFPPEAVGKLPRKTRNGGTIHLDYVDHAQVTARLLDVDPAWTWEPCAYDDAGLPAFTRDSNGRPFGLWIRLTAAGVTRLGFGELDPSKGADGVKAAVGYAIRNAAMRFGVALDLWTRAAGLAHLDVDLDGSAPPPGVDPETGERLPLATAEQLTELARLRDELEIPADRWGQRLTARFGVTDAADLTTTQAAELLELLEAATPDRVTDTDDSTEQQGDPT